MTDIQAAAPALAAETRSQRLKRATRDLHEALDARMAGADLFSTRERYALFLAIQRRFHRDIEALYRNEALIRLAPDLLERRKLDVIDQDFADIGSSPPADEARPLDPSDLPAALGWLYVAEGSSLGAAFLLKEAQKIGLSEEFGARHLAAHPEGRGLNWRRFTQALDAAEIEPEDEARAEASAVAAFKRVREIAEETLEKRAG